MATEIRVPTLGESVSEATIGRWFKKAGDTVKADEPVCELETDKVTLEVNAPAAGVLSEITVKDGDTVTPGAILGQISAGGAALRRQARPQGRRPQAAKPEPAAQGIETGAGYGNHSDPAPAAAPAPSGAAAEAGRAPAEASGEGRTSRCRRSANRSARRPSPSGSRSPATP